jgi:hypothetical protein
MFVSQLSSWVNTESALRPHEQFLCFILNPSGSHSLTALLERMKACQARCLPLQPKLKLVQLTEFAHGTTHLYCLPSGTELYVPKIRHASQLGIRQGEYDSFCHIHNYHISSSSCKRSCTLLWKKVYKLQIYKTTLYCDQNLDLVYLSTYKELHVRQKHTVHIQSDWPSELPQVFKITFP